MGNGSAVVTYTVDELSAAEIPRGSSKYDQKSHRILAVAIAWKVARKKCQTRKGKQVGCNAPASVPSRTLLQNERATVSLTHPYLEVSLSVLGVFTNPGAPVTEGFPYLSNGFPDFFERHGMGITGFEEAVDALLFEEPPTRKVRKSKCRMCRRSFRAGLGALGCCYC